MRPTTTRWTRNRDHAGEAGRRDGQEAGGAAGAAAELRDMPDHAEESLGFRDEDVRRDRARRRGQSGGGRRRPAGCRLDCAPAATPPPWSRALADQAARRRSATPATSGRRT